MNTYGEDTRGKAAEQNPFEFQHGDDWFRMKADFGQICQMIGDQVRSTVESIDFESVAKEISEAMESLAEEMKRASAAWCRERSEHGPSRVSVKINHGAGQSRKPASTSGEPASSDERLAVLRMVAEGKITADEGARLLEAMGA